MKTIANLCLAAMLAASAAHAQSVADAVAIQQHRVLSVDARVSGRLVLVDGAGKRTSYKFLLKAHGFPDGERVLEEIDTPQPVRVLARLETSGHLTARTAHKDAAGKWAGDSAAARLSDPLAGTYFTLEDLVDEQFFWKAQTLAGSGACGTRQCMTLKSEPSSTDHSQYATVVSSFDVKSGALIHVTKTVRGGGEVRELTYSDLHQSHGVTAATQIELKIAGKPGASLFVIDRGTAKANLTRTDFDLGSSTLDDAGQTNEVY